MATRHAKGDVVCMKGQKKGKAFEGMQLVQSMLRMNVWIYLHSHTLSVPTYLSVAKKGVNFVVWVCTCGDEW